MGEDKYTEWKESWRDEYLKSVCAFANAQDGVLEIERNNNNKGKIVGSANASKLLEDLSNKSKITLDLHKVLTYDSKCIVAGLDNIDYKREKTREEL